MSSPPEPPTEHVAFGAISRFILEPVADQFKRPQSLQVRNLVGSKACGLMALPTSWTPPFIVLSTALHEEWLATNKSTQLLINVGAEVVAFCSKWQSDWNKGLILRSSAANETLRDRGAYESCELPADFNPETIAQVIQQIYENFGFDPNKGSMAIIVQALASGGMRGHFSNERRVAKTINHWMWEAEAPSAGTGRFNSQRASPPDLSHSLQLKGDASKNFIPLIRSLCRWITTYHGRRSHIEWGLIEDNLWLFQLDFEEDQPDEGCDPNELLRETDDRPSGIPAQGSPWKRVDTSQRTGWSKIDKVKVFLDEQSQPYPSLYYLTAAELKQNSERGYDLTRDIEAIAHGRAVCRTDCTSAHIDRLNLPRTDSVSSEAALAFMEQTARALISQGAKDTEICFVLHKFIPARAAAWAVARPDQQIVLVDTLWGLPDGLQFLPHDTFEFDVRRDMISSEIIRYKPQFLQETSSGEWKLERIAGKLTRSRSLAANHLREVAKITHSVASKLKRPIQIMWFCDVAEGANVGQNVPWFMMDPEQPHTTARNSLAPGMARIVIRNHEDLEAAKQAELGKAILVLEPEAHLYRDTDFLNAISQVAKQFEFPVLITGSVLGHAFYTLERSGVSVRTESPIRSRVRQRQRFRKLVRDEIPAKIIGQGERVDQARIDKTEARAALVIKLFEESQELLAAQSPTDVTAELADLTEVLRSLCSATGIEWEIVQAVAEEKRKSRGSFEQNVVLMETSWPRWVDHEVAQQPKVIPLSALGQITSDKNVHQVSFSAASAKGADNILTLSNGARVAISITKDGIRVVECEKGTPPEEQLDFKF